MKKFTLVIWSAVLCSCLCTSLPAQDTIPFTLTEQHNLKIQTVFNQQDTLQLMLHTAANIVSLTKDAVQQTKSIAFSQKDSIQSWGGDNETRYSLGNTLQIQNLQVADVRIWENDYSGAGTDGKFGLNLFEGRIVEINFDESIIVLHTSLPPKAQAYERLPLTVENDFLFIEGTMRIQGKPYTNKFLIHSGYSGGVLLDDAFVNATQLGDKVEIIDEKSLKDSYGNVLKTKKAILPFFELGQSKLSDVSLAFFEGAIANQKMSVLGGDIIRRYNMIIDTAHAAIYLKQRV